MEFLQIEKSKFSKKRLAELRRLKIGHKMMYPVSWKDGRPEHPGFLGEGMDFLWKMYPVGDFLCIERISLETYLKESSDSQKGENHGSEKES